MFRCAPDPEAGVVEATQKKRIIRKALLAAAVTGVFFAPGIHEIEAAINLNFLADDGTYDQGNNNSFYPVYVVCNLPQIRSNVNCSSSGDTQLNANAHIDGTAFFQDFFTSGGKTYYHLIVGDNTKGGQARNEMALEYIIEATTNTTYSFNTGFGNDNPASATYADNSSNANQYFNMDNPYKGDDLRTGIGSANPTRVIMNQILYNADGTSNTQFLKGIQGGTVAFNQTTGAMTITGGAVVFDSKPIITQFANSAEMYNQYTIDMRHKSHSDGVQMTDAEANGPNGKITNITNLIGGAGAAKPAADQGDYDTTDATFTAHKVNNANPNYTAGTYTYTDGAADSFRALGAGGTYNYDIAATTYVETGFTPMGKDFTAFCEPSINPDWQSGTANTIGGANACKNGIGGTGGGRFGW